MQEKPIDSPVEATQPAAKGHSARLSEAFAIHRSWKISLGAAVLMALLAVLGIALTTTNREVAPTYWISLVPVFGMLCMATAWSRAFYEGGGHYLVVKQLLHWLAIAVALGADFYIRSSGQETGMAAGFNAALLLALGCLLAGIHLEWIFSFVGVLLLLVLVAVVKADQYLWLIVIIAVACVAAMLGVMSLLAKSKQRKEAARSANPPKA